MRIRLTDATRKLGQYLKRSPKDNKWAFEPIVITYNGHDKAVLLPLEAYKELKG